jgi:hypothetical protein
MRNLAVALCACSALLVFMGPGRNVPRAFAEIAKIEVDAVVAQPVPQSSPITEDISLLFRGLYLLRGFRTLPRFGSLCSEICLGCQKRQIGAASTLRPSSALMPPPSCSFLSAVSLLPIEQIVDPNRQHLEVTIAGGEDVAGGEMQRSNRNGKGRVV